MACKKILIHGYVQGVGFRWFIYKNAKTLGIKGYVKNLENGSVEAVLCGEEDKLNELIKKCYEGPPYAIVNKIDIIEKDENEEAQYTDFTIEL